MPHSLTCIYLHIIFHIKTTSPTILPNDLQPLHAYLAAAIWDICHGQHPAVGGTNNHVHILCTMPKDTTIPLFVNRLKVTSHQWLKARNGYYRPFAWQGGYGVFSVSPTNLQSVRNYIQHQAEHHQRLTARDEYLQLLHACGIEPQAVPYLLQD